MTGTGRQATAPSHGRCSNEGGAHDQGDHSAEAQAPELGPRADCTHGKGRNQSFPKEQIKHIFFLNFQHLFLHFWFPFHILTLLPIGVVKREKEKYCIASMCHAPHFFYRLLSFSLFLPVCQAILPALSLALPW